MLRQRANGIKATLHVEYPVHIFHSYYVKEVYALQISQSTRHFLSCFQAVPSCGST